MRKYTRYQKKLFFNSLLPFVLVFIIAFLVVVVFNKTARINQNLTYIDELKNVFSDLDILKNSALLAYRLDKDLSNDADAKLEQNIKIVKSNFALISEKIYGKKLSGKGITHDLYDSIKTNFNIQVNSILQLNAILKQVGAGSSGLVTKIIDTGEELSKSIEALNSASILKSYQNLLIAQNRFLIKKDKPTSNNLLSEISSLQAIISLTENVSDEITGKIALYLHSLQSLMEVNRKIGFEDNPAGIISEYNVVKKITGNLITRLDNHLSTIVKTQKSVAVILFSAIGVVLFIFITLFYYARIEKLIYKPVNLITSFINKIATGALPEEKLPVKSNNELDDLGGGNLNKIVSSLTNKTLFLDALNQGNLDAKLELLGKDDKLGKALLGVQVNIQKSAEEQKNHDAENERRRYINEGLAKFSEITHARYENIENLTDVFIKELVKYLNSIQGGVFLTKETDETTELYLSSAFAYDRKKFLTKTVAPGEGLIGTCALEKKLIMVTEVPADYISITSGLGDAPPDTILLVPMLRDNQLTGVIEIATLNKFQEHQTDFVKQVANNLANTLESARINQRTSKLLTESQLHAQTMSEQEEEMRQNMEELKATQEESTRREEEFKGIADALGKSVFVAEFDIKGNLISVNDKFMVFLGKNQNQLLGKTFDIIIGNDKTPVFDEKAAEEVLNGKHMVLTQNIKIGRKKDYKVQFHFTPELNRDDFPFKILCLGIELI